MFDLWPLGIVRNGIHCRPEDGWKDIESEITIYAPYEDGLVGIDEFSHIVIVFWLHQQMGQRSTLLVHPRGNVELPLTGVFATRSARRPNPIGVTRAKLLYREDCQLTVRGLDALDGSFILDIKGDIPYSTEDAEYPEWTNVTV